MEQAGILLIQIIELKLRNRLLVLILGAVFGLNFFACQNNSASPQSSTTVEIKKTEEHPFLGAFQKISIDSPEALAAYNFLIQELKAQKETFSITRLLEAEAQIVAGTNYRLKCEALGLTGKKLFILVLIFKSLDEKYQLKQISFF